MMTFESKRSKVSFSTLFNAKDAVNMVPVSSDIKLLKSILGAHLKSDLTV